MSEPSEIANSEQKSQLIEEVKSNSFMEQLRQAKARRRRRKNKSEGKRLRVTVWHTDAGKPGRNITYNNWFASRKLLKNDSKVYSTDPRNEKKRNFNIVFCAEGDKEFSRGEFDLKPVSYRIVIPANYDNPLSRGLVFVLNSLDELKHSKAFDGCDRKHYDTHCQKMKKFQKSQPTGLLPLEKQREVYARGIRETTSMRHVDGLPQLISDYAADNLLRCTPVSFFEINPNEGTDHMFKIDFPRKGKLVAVKLIDAYQRRPAPEVPPSGHWAPTTIDVQHVAFYA
uniref:Uncharacterized protein n=1 Tax=Amorphochlora amoebiformis TaxID=1561963 RepID=A0A7S0GXA5_9EUKA